VNGKERKCQGEARESGSRCGRRWGLAELVVGGVDDEVETTEHSKAGDEGKSAEIQLHVLMQDPNN
jgi:hypothetical protein